jgi:Cd2+/Zn2+-exporting ATPase
MLDALHRLGVRRTVLLSGDDPLNAAAVGRNVGVDEAHGDLLPDQKVAFVRRLMKEGERVLMLGDGTNDAPALSSATVGIALASGGGGITAEAADAVILADDPSRVAEAIAISRRTLRLARQSIWAGSGSAASPWDSRRRDDSADRPARCCGEAIDSRHPRVAGIRSAITSHLSEAKGEVTRSSIR